MGPEKICEEKQRQLMNLEIEKMDDEGTDN